MGIPVFPITGPEAERPGVVWNQTARAGLLSNELIVRAARPVRLASVEAPDGKLIPSTARPRFKSPDRMHPKSRTTDVPDSKITGEPIEQLNRSRNPWLTPRKRWGGRSVNPAGHPAKRGVFELAGARLPILREPEAVRKRRAVALVGEFKRAIRAESPGVVLDTRGASGLDYYRNPRVKPALPNLRMDVPTATRPVHAVGSMFQLTTAPAYVSSRLADEGRALDARGYASPAPAGRAVPIRVPSLATQRASVDPAQTTTTKGGRVLFFVAAAALAFMVLR